MLATRLKASKSLVLADPDLILVFDTSLGNTTIEVPFGNSATVDVTVDWGDSTSDAYTTNGTKTHTYASGGVYTVRISGSLSEFGTGTGTAVLRPELTECVSFGDLGLTSIAGAFRACGNITAVPNQIPSTVTTLLSCFRGANSFNQDINSWDVSNVTNMERMFQDNNGFNGNITSWDVSNVNNMLGTFFNASQFNQNISSWNVSNVTNMNSMFRSAGSFNQNLSSWITGLTAQPLNFSTSANATFADNANGLKPYLSDGVTQINT